MARLLEHHVKDVLRSAGIPVPDGEIADTPSRTEEIARHLVKPVVVKALVPVGRRRKAGLVAFCDRPAEARSAAERMLGNVVEHHRIRQVLVEEKLNIEKEYYISFSINLRLRRPVGLFVRQGGIHVEEHLRLHPEAQQTIVIEPWRGLQKHQAVELVSHSGAFTGKALIQASELLVELYRVFEHSDAKTLEVNPLALTVAGKLIAASALMSVDDAAIARHPGLADKIQIGQERAWRPLTELEMKAIEVQEKDPYRGTARYTEFDDGDTGFLCGGGGASLLMLDVLRVLGARPANYSEFGGNPSAEKVCGLLKVILAKPGVRGLLVAQNVTNNTQVDVEAEGILQALNELHIVPATFPVVVRLAGVAEGRAREIFQNAGIEYYGDEITLTAAARRFIEKMRDDRTAK
ncbi:MAG: acetate--CoA ligase family protein [Candidatus Latescibacteria bacterium]|nr:acetate--CoA ligase family protein [Candidatus Latescibacterota bacterium]